MNRDEAMIYGKKIGCKYYVYNNHGGLHGGFKTLEAAEAFKKECEDKYKNDKLNSDMTFYIKEA